MRSTVSEGIQAIFDVYSLLSELGRGGKEPCGRQPAADQGHDRLVRRARAAVEVLTRAWWAVWL